MRIQKYILKGFCISMLTLSMIIGNVVLINAANDWKSAYYAIIKPMSDNGDVGSFFLEDFDGDGIPELTVGDHTIYKYDGSKAVLLEDFSSQIVPGYGDVWIYKYKDKSTGKTDYYLNFMWHSKLGFDRGSMTKLNMFLASEDYDLYDNALRSEKYTEFWNNFNKNNELIQITEYSFKTEDIIKSGIAPAGTTNPDKPTVVLNGSILDSDVAPQNIGGSIYVEMRSLLESLGYNLSYNEKTKDITIRKKNLTFIIQRYEESDSGYIVRYDNSTTKESFNIDMEQLPKVINSRTMLPLRTMGNLFGMAVDWNGNTNTASLTSFKAGVIGAARNGLHYVDISRLNSKNELTITGFYYCAGRTIESLYPVMILLEDSKQMTLPVKKDSKAYIHGEPIPLNKLNEAIYEGQIYYINIFEGTIVFIDQMYMP